MRNISIKMTYIFTLLILTLTWCHVNTECILNDNILRCSHATTDEIYRAVRINSEDILLITIMDHTNFTDGRITSDLFNVPNLINLQILIVQDTNLEYIENDSFIHLQRLYSIGFDHDSVKEVTGEIFNGLNNSMTILTLFDNQLYDIDCNIFQVIPKLHELQFAMNRVSEYNCSSTALKYLNIGLNSFTKLDVDSIVRNNPKLETLLIQWNHFSCDDLQIIINKLKQYNIEYVLDNQKVTDVPNVDGVVCYNN